jgi:hypothetical protein
VSLPDATTLAAFGLLSGLQQVIPWGSGHIHASFKVQCCGRDYLMQRINRTVFHHPRLVMENIARVTAHTHQRLQDEDMGDADIRRRTLTLVPTRYGRTLYRSKDGEWWRLYHFISGSNSVENSSSPEMLYHAG